MVCPGPGYRYVTELIYFFVMNYTPIKQDKCIGAMDYNQMNISNQIFFGFGFFLVLASTNFTALLMSSSDMSTMGAGAEILLAVMIFSRLESPDIAMGLTFSH